MPVELAAFLQKEFAETGEAREVTRLAHLLQSHLNAPSAQALLAAANRPGVASQQIQNVLLDYARELGFANERAGLFST